MAGIYSGIHLKLKNSNIAWEHKLKLAHFAWISHQCLIPNKEQFLLDWVSQTLVGVHTKKLSLEEDVEQKLWIFLDSILHSKRIQRLMEEGKPLKLRFAIAQVMNDIFARTTTQSCPSAGIGTVLSCCQSVLSIPCFGMIYRAKYELMVELLNKLCLLACHCLTLEHPITHQVLSVLNIALKQYILLQRQQSNTNRLFMHVLTQLLEPCLLLRSDLNIHVFDKDSNNALNQIIKDIRSNIEVVLHIGLFQAELCTFYKEELLSQSEKSEKKKLSFKDCLTPVYSMLAKLEKIKCCEEKKQLLFLADSVPFLYKLFLDSYCRDGNEVLCFEMLVKLFRCLCAPFTANKADLRVSFSTWTIGITALESMLSLVFCRNIYNIAEDNIRGKGMQYKFYRSISEILVCNSCTPSLPWFKCLKTLNLLNHLIIEPDVTEILHVCFNADVSDSRIQKAQEALVDSLLMTYTKLRQFPKLFQKILNVISQRTEKIKDDVLSDLTKKLSEFLVQLPPNQMLDMWAMVLENCQISHIKDDPNVSLKLKYLSTLLHCLMMNMKSLDNNTPVSVIQRFQHLMKEVAELLILPSLTILKLHDGEVYGITWIQKMCEVVLLILYTWIEVNTVSTLNCDSYVSQMRRISLTDDLSAECWNFSIFFEDKECWHKVYTLCKQSDPVSMFYLGLLSIQKIKLILMNFHISTETEIQAFQASVSFFVNAAITLMNHKALNQISGVNCLNYLPVAQWHFLVSNISILLPYISLQDMNNIAHFLLETRLSTYVESNQVEDDVTDDFKEISKYLLQSESFSEISIFQCVFITAIFKKCAVLVRGETLLHEIFDLLSFKDSDWHENIISVYYKGNKIVNSRMNDSCDDSVFVTNMKNALQLVCAASKINVRFTHGDLKLLMELIELISMLKPDSLPSSDLCRCFFFLLTLASSLKSPHVASVCYKGLTCLLSGTNANYLFKIAYASDILKVVMTCIQSAHWTVTDSDEQYIPQFLDIMNTFFDSFLSLMIKRRQSVRINLEQCTSFVLNSLIPNAEKTFWSTCIGQLHIVILKNLCHHLVLAIKEQNAKVELVESLNSLLKQTAAKLKTIVQQSLEISVSSPFLPSLLVTSTTTLLEAERSIDGNLQNPEMYRVFCLQIMKELCYAMEQNAFLKPALHYLTVCVEVKEVHPKQHGFATSVFIAVGNLLASPHFNKVILKDAEIDLQRLFNGVTENCSCEEFQTLLKLLFKKLEVCNLWRQSYKVLFTGVTMIRLLLNCPLQEDKSTLFWSSSSQIITALVTLSMEACKDRLLFSTIVVPVIDTMALFLRRGELFLSNPHHVTLSLRAILSVPLENVKAEDYYSTILAIHEVLFSVLQCYPKVMLKSVPTFLSCFHRLVASVMYEGRQKGDKGAICIQKCAKLVERMYTHIASKTEEFTVFSTFIVSQYIHELQKVTLQPEVRRCLTEGIFHILDLCIDRDVKFLNTSLQTGAREVFKDLYQDYSSHYKTRNKEEDKYTV